MRGDLRVTLAPEAPQHRLPPRARVYLGFTWAFTVAGWAFTPSPSRYTGLIHKDDPLSGRSQRASARRPKDIKHRTAGPVRAPYTMVLQIVHLVPGSTRG